MQLDEGNRIFQLSMFYFSFSKKLLERNIPIADHDMIIAHTVEAAVQ